MSYCSFTKIVFISLLLDLCLYFDFGLFRDLLRRLWLGLRLLFYFNLFECLVSYESMVQSQHFINKIHSRPIAPLKQTEVESCKCHGPGKNDKHAEPLVPEEASPIFIFGHQSKFGVKYAHSSQSPHACKSVHSSPFKRIIHVPNAAYPAENAVQETRNETNNEGCPRFAAITNTCN